MNETIVAPATGPIKSALAIVRISGEDCFSLVSKIFSKDINDIKERTALVGEIVDGNKVIDDVVIIAYKGPRSFTGEDQVEIMCHGSLLIVNEIISLCIKYGARLATRGEFSSRAFLNNKIDLIQAEAINDVINATTKEAKELSLMSLQGETSKLIEPIKQKITDLVSQIEVNIDYPEYEDIGVVANQRVIEDTAWSINEIDKLIDDGVKGKIIKEGINVVIVGKPNVGKSTLLNAILGEEKAIVSSIPGTTRDVVEGDVNLDGLILHLLDTAGIRNTKNTIEKIGVERSKAAIEKADLVIVVLDSEEAINKDILNSTKDKKVIVVRNKADLVKSRNSNEIYISALNKDIDELKKAIKKMFGLDSEVFKRPSLNNARQIGVLEKIKNDLVDANKDAKNNIPLDLVETSLMSAFHSILQLTGEETDDALYSAIFSRFCVGK